MLTRRETRIERYKRKASESIKLPASLVTINFQCDGNLAFLIRSAVCYGISTVHVIGSIPARKDIYSMSGSTVDFVELKQYSRPSEFLRYVEQNDINLISAEIAENSKSLFDYKFDFSRSTAIVLGNETSGIPLEILMNSEIIHIPMMGAGFCLNTSQTGTAFMNEYARQFSR